MFIQHIIRDIESYLFFKNRPLCGNKFHKFDTAPLLSKDDKTSSITIDCQKCTFKIEYVNKIEKPQNKLTNDQLLRIMAL